MALPAAVLAAFFVSSSVSIAQPALPQIFYGTVKYSGATETEVPQGTVIVGMVGGEERGRVALPRLGLLGDPETQCSELPCLLVQGSIVNGATVSFVVGGVAAQQTVPFKSGDVSEVHLRILDAIPPLQPGAPSKTTAIGDSQGSFTWGASQDQGSGLAGYQVQLDGGSPVNVVSTTWTAPTPLNEGGHTFSVTAFDRAGNFSAPAILSFVVDAPPGDTYRAR